MSSEIRRRRSSCVFFSLLLFVVSVLVQSEDALHNRNFFELDETSYDIGEIPEEGAVTMAFVFDVTGSMYDDLVQVIEGAVRILDTVLHRRDRLLHNYVLVPFHDPDVGPATVTTDHQVFLRHLRDLYVQGGGDCPEASVAAIKLALEVCLPNSFVYVFTDASSKDHHLLQDVLTLIQRKQSQVVFVMTGDCGDPTHPGFQAYERIASTSSGQVFLLKKSDVEEVLNFVRVSLQARKVNLLAVDNGEGSETSLPLVVDTNLKEFTVSLSGDNPSVQLFDPLGAVVDETSGLNDLLNLSNVQVVNVKDPKSGTWNVKVVSNSSHTVRATGLSPVDFVFGFSVRPTSSLQHTYHRPLKGAVTYLLINATDLPEVAFFETVDLVSLSGTSLATIPLSALSSLSRGMYNATPFVPPDEFFYLKIIGYDELGLPMQRISPTAISSQLPAVPEVTVRVPQDVHYGNTIQLICHVQSLVPFTVRWSRGAQMDVSVGQHQEFPQTSQIILTLTDITSAQEDVYNCVATNIAGSASANAFLDVREPPPFVDELDSLNVEPGARAVFVCTARSPSPFNLTWARYDQGPTRRRFSTDLIVSIPRFKDHGNGTLTVEDVRQTDEGWYRCTASNEGGPAHQRMYFAVQKHPRVTLSSNEATIISGTSLTIACESEGIPKPDVEWLRNGELVKDSRHVRVSRGTLQFVDAGRTEEGTYECRAHNAAGSDSQSVRIKYLEPPIISKEHDTIRSLLGHTVTLPCKVDTGHSAALVSWTRSDSQESKQFRRGDLLIDQEADDVFVVLDDGGLRFRVDLTDAGQYKCTAQNEAGKDEHIVSLIVLVPPSKPVIPSNESPITVLLGSKQELHCWSSGYPAPIITWFKDEVLQEGAVQKLDPNAMDDTEPGTLIISRFELFHAGIYSCVATNEAGHSVSDDIELVVYDPPRIEASDAENIDVVVGHDTVLSCKANGHPPPVISWQKDNVSLEPSNLILYLNGSMLIHNAQPDDSGVYRCTASNDAGFDHRDMKLSVLVPPSIDPSALHMRPEVLEGEKATLSCPVAASPPPTITWIKDDEVIADRNDVILRDGGRELVISSVNVNDAGNYICLALNSAGATQSVVALDVLVKPKFVDDGIDYEGDVSIVEKSRLELECRAEGHPTPNIEWTFIGDQSSRKPVDDVYVETDNPVSYLVIESVRRTNTGAYVCEATNKVGSIERLFYVSVLVPPKLMGLDDEVKEVLLGSEVTLECPVEGQPKPTVTWTKESKLLDRNVSLSSDNQTLTIVAVTMQDSGVYKCLAKNVAGVVSKSIALNIIAPPKIDESDETNVYRVRRGSSVELNCHVRGSSDHSVIWLKDGNLTTSSEKHSSVFALDFADIRDAGRYTCTVSNKAGIDSKDFVVEVMDPPHMSVSDDDETSTKQAKAGSSVQFHCPVTGHPKPLVTWLKHGLQLEENGHYQVSDDGSRLLVFNIGRDQAGVYACVANNEAGQAQREFQLDVLVPPSIITPLSGRDVGMPILKVISEEKLVIECPVLGNPLPTIEWFKDGVPIWHTDKSIEFEDEKQTMIIRSVFEHDAGQYTCVATNVAGWSEKKFQVEVQQIPKLEIPLTEIELNVSVLIHRPITLHCPIGGYPAPDIIWMKDEKVVAIEGNVEVSDNGRKLLIQQTTVEDQGRYTCYAINEVGETILDFDVDVKAPPSIDRERVKPTLKAVENDSLVIECPADGHPLPIITWLKDGQLLQFNEGSGYSSENRSQVLVVKRANAEHAGQYTCVASNEAGATEQNFKLNVQIPPKFETAEKKEEPNVLLYRPLVIYCPVVGIPPPSVTWFKNDQPIHLLSDPNIIQSFDGKRLKLRRAQIEDAATYKCVAVNEAGRTEQEFRVSVHVPPKILNKDRGQFATNVEVSEGEIVQLECRASGTPEPTIIWLKNGHLIGVLRQNHNDVSEDIEFLSDTDEPHENHFEIVHDGRLLKIVGPHPADGGRYTCVASNVAGTTERNFDLEILVSPKIVGPREEEKRALLNRPVNLECPIEANPPPSSIIWLKDGQLVNGFRLLSGGRHLYLSHALRTDAGLYTCVAENSVGRAEKSYKLDILVPPMILPSKRKQAATVGQSVVLDCMTSGHPQPTVTWLKDETLLTVTDIEEMKIVFHDNNQRLEVRNATVLDSGHFTCMVSNEAGLDEEHYQVDITAPPSMKFLEPIDRFLSLQLNQQLRLDCPVTSGVPVTITWYKNGDPLVSSDDPFVHLSSDAQSVQLVRARREDAGKYECVAKNLAGEARTEFHLEIFVPPKIESPLADDQGTHHVVQHQPADFECYVSGHPEPTVSWLKNGQTVQNIERNKLLSNGQHFHFDSVEVTDTGQYTCVATNSAGTTERDFYLAVQVPPLIDRTISKDHIVVVSHSMTLPCSANGVPEPMMTWSRNGVAVDQFNTPNVKISKYGLTILRSRKSDAGQYSCYARNTAGEDQVTHTLSVYSPPVIDRSNTGGPTQVVLNHTLVLECPATGHPLPVIKWAKDGQSLDETLLDHRRKFLSEGQTLHIAMVISKDEGRYECVALNDAGQDQVEQQVDVLVPPRSHLHPSEVKHLQVVKGEPATMFCPIDGDPTPNIIWLKDGQMFDPLHHLNWQATEEQFTLKLLKAQEVDGGRYTCVGSNAAGDYELDTDLEVLVPPTIKTSPDATQIQLIEGLSIALDCLPYGQPIPEIKWLHNGVSLTTSSSNVRLTHSGHRLRFESAQRHQGGNFTCVATNSIGVAQHSFALVVIVPPTMNLSLLDSNPSAVLYDNVTLTCPVSGNPFPKILWYHESHLLMAGGAVHFSDGGTNLTITNVLRSHQGSYTCLASNDGGTVDANILLTVWIPPNVVGATNDDPIVVPVVIRQPVVLECNLKVGFPSPTITWMKNYEVLADDQSGRLIVGNRGQTLNITHALRQDEDLYACIVENEAGVTEKEFRLDVMVPPEMHVSESSVDSLEVINGQPLLVECPISGDPPPMVTWLKNRQPLVASDHLKFLKDDRIIYFENATASESADYTCVATNEAGVHEMDFTVRVQMPPTISSKIQNVSIIVHRPLRLECSASGIPQPDVHWTKDGYRLNTSTSEGRWTNGPILQLHRVLSEHRGQYVCTAINVAGSMTKVVNVDVFEPPQIADSSAALYRDILRVVGEEVVLSCEVLGHPTPHIVWYKGDQPLHVEEEDNVEFRNDSQELHLSDAKVEDSALYRCVASNVAGNVSRTFKVEVAVPPMINGVENVQLQVVLNQRVDLPCVAFGHPLPTIFWSRNGSTLTEVGSNHYVTDDGTLTILAARLQDDGSYLCHAVNDAGGTTRNFTIHVMMPPTIVDGPLNVAVIEHEVAVLPCRVRGTPHPNVSWTRDGVTISANVSFEGSFFLSNVSVSHSGTYTCTAWNTAGTASVQRHLQVNVPPTVTPDQPSNYSAVRGQDVVLGCNSRGIPVPQTVWEWNGEIVDLLHPRYALLSDGGLKILNVQSSDTGSYGCSVYNTAGTDRYQLQLVVMTPPKIKSITNRPSDDFVVTQGASIHFLCLADGYPTPKITWMRDGSIISQHADFELHRVKVADDGQYVCLAVNDAGRDHKEATLVVQVPPTLVILPMDKHVAIGKVVELTCEAEGIPMPTIIWHHNGDPIPVSHSTDGRSVLSVHAIHPEDGGTYSCVATNNAGDKHTDANVKVLIPPKIIRAPGSYSVRRDASLVLPCDVEGDPVPSVLWTKDGHRLMKNDSFFMDDGWLLLENVQPSDAGLYKCIATNEVGIVESHGFVTVLEELSFVVSPRDTVAILGDSIILDCVSQGIPKPTVQWSKARQTIDHKNVLLLSNSSLQIFAVQVDNEGIYRCTATNELGEVASVDAKVTVMVHGGWSSWSNWSLCSTSCGIGIETRKRVCDNPSTRNGGTHCQSGNHETRSCQIKPCPVSGGWSDWQIWAECSVSCGRGSRSRVRRCDSPSPAHDGTDCEGNKQELEVCYKSECPVHGEWGQWTSWSQCSVSCGIGLRKRSRQCDEPSPLYGGRNCVGFYIETTECHQPQCEVDGQWGPWSVWSSCSRSCAGGKRLRSRLCDSPAPLNGGRNCTGQPMQSDYCNNDPCPIHGNWASWSSWGECSASCNGGQRRRFRTCNNPEPSNSGRSCVGPGQDTEACGSHNCPEHGRWSSWIEWSQCSASCDRGTRQRQRSCTEPRPKFGGKLCPGDATQAEGCFVSSCQTNQMEAVGNVLGVVNGLEFGLSQLRANISRYEGETTVEATISNITQEAANSLRILVSMLSSIYWTMAHEEDQAVNGYTLTSGYFLRDTQVTFVTGEVLKMSQVSRGMDGSDGLLVDVVVNGNVPELPQEEKIRVNDFTEDYVQVGSNTLYALSTRTFQVDGYTLPYAWIHTVRYDEDREVMPYLVERLRVGAIRVNYDSVSEELKFSVSASITKGSPSNECPVGFLLNVDGVLCEDVNECSRETPCSHGCSNSLGSYSCSCPSGYTLGPNGHNCQDLDECHFGLDDCFLPEECENTIGSFRCLAICEPGFHRTTTGLGCQDIDECTTQPQVCDQQCLNLIGGYRCDCHIGYRLIGKSKCLDIDECDQMESPCSHRCINNLGSFLCDCPQGFALSHGRHCEDIDECLTGSHECSSEQECQNTVGGFRCSNVCPSGFAKRVNGSCEDVNECKLGLAMCHFTQICENSHGSYHCVCPQGYKSVGRGQPCQDFNECLGEGTCQHECENTIGSYVCHCPPGYKLDGNGRNCQDIDECVENGIECDRDEICFNTRGAHHCIEAPCPHLFERDPINGYCILPCDRSDVPCPLGVKYAESLAYKTVSLASDIRPYQDLVRLVVYDQNGKTIPNTLFAIAEDAEGRSLFRIRQNGGKGVLYTVKSLDSAVNYETKVVATSYDATRKVVYKNNFIVFISVGEFPY